MTNHYPIAAPAAKKQRNTLLILGVAVLLAGLLTAAALWYASGKRYDDAVSGLARAPVGCDTTLDFDATGEFLIFLESKGSIDDVAGDCGAEGAFSTDRSSLPAVRVTLLDPDGAEVDLDRRSGITYDTDGSVGQSIRAADIVEAGLHTLRVESSSNDVALAVGRDPSNGVGALKNGAALAAIAGLIGGGALLIASTRRRIASSAVSPAQWQPTGQPGWTAAPPGIPQGQAAPNWQEAVGPPAHSPQQPPVAPPGTWPPGAQNDGPQAPNTIPAPTWQGQAVQPAAPQSWTPQAPSVPQPPGEYPAMLPHQQPPPPAATHPSLEDGAWPGRTDGSSGDGERSPWAPPTDEAH